MSRVQRWASVPVIVSFFLSATGVAQAQSVPVPATPVVAQAPAAAAAPAAANDNMAGGLLEGETLAESQGAGGKLGVGLAVGVLTGVIGTGIGYFFVGPAPLSAEALQRSVGKSQEFQIGLKAGWERKTKSKKRNAFLAGGLLGTAAFFVVVAAANSEE